MKIRGLKVWISAFALVVMAVGTLPAQEVELPLTWKGEGKAVIMFGEEPDSIELSASFTIDTDGWATGKFSNDEGSAELKRFYFTQEENNARQLVLVVVVEDSDEPMLFVLDCRVLRGTLLYGEVLAKPYEKGGEVEKGLNIGDKTAQELFPDYMPAGLKKAMSVCKPAGFIALKGGIQK